MTGKSVRSTDLPEPWDGDTNYGPYSKCLHKGKTWQCGSSGVYNKLIEPGGFTPFFWMEVDRKS
jgi:hypothetical protein